MAVEDWIDSICDLAGEVETGKTTRVRSYLIFRKPEFPAALTVFPCALVYPEDVASQVSEGGVCIEVWNGRIEFHITENDDKSRLGEVIRYYARIRNAFALHQTLGGKVAYCTLRDSESGPNIEGPVKLQYGLENPHLGLIAYWTVKENVAGQVTFGL